MIFNPTIDSFPASDTISVFSCDENYFLNYGIYNILSCNKILQDVHVNIINPGKESFNKLSNLKSNLKINLTFSYEKIDIKNFFALKSYLFCNRYFISLYIFNHSNVKTIFITDADIIFKKSINFPKDKFLGIIYKPENNTLWKQSGGNLVIIKEKYKNFLKKFISEFDSRFQKTVWKDFSNFPKLERANIVGLDQICLSVLAKDYKEDKNFINLANGNFISKNINDNAFLWSLTGNSKKNKNLSEKIEKFLQ